MKWVSFNELSISDQELLTAARCVMENSYSPYSGFRVGAAVRGISGKIHIGTNLESADYIVQHAETIALGQAVSIGDREIIALAVIARGETALLSEPCAPCGACRQQIYEFRALYGKLFPIILSNSDMTKILITDIDELLPLAFGPKSVEVGRKKAANE